MGHSQDDRNHFPHEAEQNEIGGPVIFALVAFALVILAIYFMIAWRN